MHRFACTGTQSPTGCVELGRVCLSNNVRSRKIEFGVRDKWACPVEFQGLHEQLLQMVFAESIDHAFRRKSSGHGLPLGYSVGKHFGWVIKSFLFSYSSAWESVSDYEWKATCLPIYASEAFTFLYPKCRWKKILRNSFSRQWMTARCTFNEIRAEMDFAEPTERMQEELKVVHKSLTTNLSLKSMLNCRASFGTLLWYSLDCFA